MSESDYQDTGVDPDGDHHLFKPTLAFVTGWLKSHRAELLLTARQLIVRSRETVAANEKAKGPSVVCA